MARVFALLTQPAKSETDDQTVDLLAQLRQMLAGFGVAAPSGGFSTASSSSLVRA